MADATARDAPLATGWGAHEPVDDSVLRRFVFNQRDTLRTLATGPTARWARDDDVVMVDSGGPVPDSLLGSPVGLRLGLVDGAPVSAAAVHAAHGVVNLCFAATLPAGRRRGVWSALVWDRVIDAPDQPAVAFTSDDSRPGFVKLGFLPMQRFTLYVRPPGA